MDNDIYNLEIVIKDQPPITVRTDGSDEQDALNKAMGWILQFHPEAEYITHLVLLFTPTKSDGGTLVTKEV